VQELWRRIATDYPAIELCVLCIMPDHLHGVLRVTKPLGKPLGVPLRAFKSQATSALRKCHGNPSLNRWCGAIAGP